MPKQIFQANTTGYFTEINWCMPEKHYEIQLFNPDGKKQGKPSTAHTMDHARLIGEATLKGAVSSAREQYLADLRSIGIDA